MNRRKLDAYNKQRNLKTGPDLYGLRDGDKVCSLHPSIEGAKLSAVFHIKDGEHIFWEPELSAPTQVAAWYGRVNKQDGPARFVVYSLN